MLRIADTGNDWLAGEDPNGGLKAVRHLLACMHAKHITVRRSEAERGKVTGTPVGCACGHGVLDWQRVVAMLRECGFSGPLLLRQPTPRG